MTAEVKFRSYTPKDERLQEFCLPLPMPADDAPLKKFYELDVDASDDEDVRWICMRACVCVCVCLYGTGCLVGDNSVCVCVLSVCGVRRCVLFGCVAFALTLGVCCGDVACAACSMPISHVVCVCVHTKSVSCHSAVHADSQQAQLHRRRYRSHQRTPTGI